MLASVENNRLTLWEVRAHRPQPPLTGVGDRVWAVAMTADGRTLLTHDGDGALTLWDGRNGHRLRTLANCQVAAGRPLISPDGRRALAINWLKGSPIYWDLTTGRRRPGFSGLNQPVSCAAFSVDSALLALGVYDGCSGFIHLREATTGRELRRLTEGKNCRVQTLAFSPNGRTLAAGYADGSLTLWDLITNRPRHRLTGPKQEYVWPMAFSPDSRLLALVWARVRVIHLYETVSGQEIQDLRGQPTPIYALAFSPDSCTLAAGGEPFSESDTASPDPLSPVGLEAAIRLWDVPRGKQIHLLRGHREGIHTLAFSTDGETLVSGGYDLTVLSWDVAPVTRRSPVRKDLSPARLAALWTDLAAREAAVAQRAVLELIQSPGAALSLLEKALPPVPPEKMAPIVALIADLDHEEFTRRERASKELEKIGEPAIPALSKVLNEKPSLEVRKRIDALLEALDGRPTSPERLRTLRALQVLETIGTPKAMKILECLAGGAAEAALTQEAKSALTRLSRRNADR